MSPATEILSVLEKGFGEFQDYGEESQDWRAVEVLAKKIGVKYAKRKPGHLWFPDEQWDGNRASVATPEQLLHEIAHYQVCPPRRRSFADYGLGDSSMSKTSLKARIDWRDAMTEEMYASLLGILWSCALGLNWIWVFDDHQWSLQLDQSRHDIPIIFRGLERLGLMKGGFPKPKVRMPGMRIYRLASA